MNTKRRMQCDDAPRLSQSLPRIILFKQANWDEQGALFACLRYGDDQGVGQNDQCHGEREHSIVHLELHEGNCSNFIIGD